MRIDSHCYSGYTIPPYYDSMIAKVMTYGRNRELALDRMDRALGEYLVRGIKTNIPFSRAIIRDPHFRAGKATTKFKTSTIDDEPWVPPWTARSRTMAIRSCTSRMLMMTSPVLW